MNRGEKSVPAGRRNKGAPSPQRGAILMAILVLLGAGALYFFLKQLDVNLVRFSREQNTAASLAQARDALLGYALKYREDQLLSGQPDRMYGYLPLPDLGTSRNNNVGCVQEGCDANTFTGIAFDANGIGPTVVGRFPWKTLGTEPLRDAHGECLWLIVSSLHGRIHRSVPPPILPPMNWDTLGQLDVVLANGTAALNSALAGAHDRPVAIIFSPGPPLPGQNRDPSATDDVSQCGGNYDARNYLDPANLAALGGISNYLAGTNGASGSTGDSDRTNDPDAPKALLTRGKIFESGGNFLPDACQGANCNLVANDLGLPIAGDTLFGAIRKSSHFRTDINAMLDRMATCLRDNFVAGGFAPDPITGYVPPADKAAGRIPADACYDNSKSPLGYFDHYKEMVFVAKPNSGAFTVSGEPNCAGVLLFAGQRNISTPLCPSAAPVLSQRRSSNTERNDLCNYLEGINLAGMTSVGATFAGDSQFDRTPPQAVGADIVRCIPTGASFTTVTSPTLPGLGFGQLVDYNAATRTLTLGKQDVTTGYGAPANALFGCAWFSEARAPGSGLRAYYRFQFKQVGTSVGSNGFVFAIADALRNNLLACGAAGSHLGYSGDNGVTPKITYPKIGIEFDQGRNTGFSENPDPTASGRNDPCGASSCGGTAGFNSHAAIVYWGHESANATDAVTLPDFDDNAHGFPSAGSLPTSLRPPPRAHDNPATETGIKFVNLRGNPNDSSLYHVRVELTPTRTTNADARLSNTVMDIKVWIADDATTSADRIAALKNTTRPMSVLDATFAPKLSDTPTLYDVTSVPVSACPCAAGQACGSDNLCYRPALEKIQLGFTGSQRTSDQEVTISDFFTTWLP